MQVRQIHYRPMKFRDLIDRIDCDEIQAYAEQRQYVWKDEHIKEMLTTILLGRSLGTCVFLNYPLKKQRSLRIDGVDPYLHPSEVTPKYVVLDGQQRLVTLYNVFKRCKDGDVYYLMYDIDKNDLEKVLNGSEIEDENGDNGMNRNTVHRFCIPTNIIFEERKFDEFINRLIKRHDGYDEYFTNLKYQVRECVFDGELGIQVYEPLLSTSSSDIKELARNIYYDINFKGVRQPERLHSTSYLVRISGNRYDYEFLIRKRVESDKILERYVSSVETDIGIDQLSDMVKMTTILINGYNETGAVPSASSNFLTGKSLDDSFKKSCSQDNVKYAIKSISTALDNVQKGFYNVSFRYMPKLKNIIPFLAGLHYIGEQSDLSGAFQKIALWWYVRAMFSDRFVASGMKPESVFADYAELVRKVTGKEDHKRSHSTKRVPVIQNFDTSQVMDTCAKNLDLPSQASDMKILLNTLIIIVEGASDLYDTRKLIEFDSLGSLNTHHIFPTSVYGTDHTDFKRIDTFMNLVKTTRDTNQVKFRDALPSEQLRLINHRLVRQGLDPNIAPEMKKHLIDDSTITAMKNDDFHEFLECRKKSILDRIKYEIEKFPFPMETHESIKRTRAY